MAVTVKTKREIELMRESNHRLEKVFEFDIDDEEDSEFDIINIAIISPMNNDIG